MNLGVTPEKSIFGLYSLVEWFRHSAGWGFLKSPSAPFSCWESPTRTWAKCLVVAGLLESWLRCQVMAFFAVNDDSCLGNAPILTWEIRNRESRQHMGELIGTQHTAGSYPASSRLGTSERQSRLYCQEPVQSMLHSCCSLTTEFLCVARIQTFCKWGLIALWVSWTTVEAPDWGSLSSLLVNHLGTKPLTKKVGRYRSVASFWRWKPRNKTWPELKLLTAGESLNLVQITKF